MIDGFTLLMTVGVYACNFPILVVIVVVVSINIFFLFCRVYFVWLFVSIMGAYMLDKIHVMKRKKFSLKYCLITWFS